MTEGLGGVTAACGMILVLELAGRLAPRHRLVGFVKALAVLVLLGTALARLFSLDWEPLLPAAVEPDAGELTAFLEEKAEIAAAQDQERYLAGLLAAADIPAKKISVKATIRADGRIHYTSVWVRCSYPGDAVRARALLGGMLEPDAVLEVTADDP